MKYFWIFLFISLHSFAQRGIVPYYAQEINYQKHAGYITLNSGEKISGVFQYDANNFKSFSPAEKLIKRYKSSDIAGVALAGNDTTLTAKDSTYFTRLDESKTLYRQLTFGSLQVYDNSFNVNERNGWVSTPFLVKTNNQLIKFNSEDKFIKWMQTNNADKIKWNKSITAAGIIKQLNGIN